MILALLISVPPALSAASPPGPQPRRPIILERYGDAPGTPALRTSPPSAGGLRDFMRQVNVNAAGLNIVGDAANEPSIAVDPTAPNRIVITWRQFDTIASNFRQAGYAFTRDGGRTWEPHTLDPGNFRTDPVLRFDADGVLYWNSLFISNDGAGSYRGDIFRSFNAGQSWTGPIFCYGGDKAWMAIDRTTGIGRGNLYQAWNTAGNPTPGSTFNRSVNHALGWSVPQPLPASPCWGQPVVGPDGELYINGTANGGGSSCAFLRSLNARDPAQAPTFLAAVTVPLGGFLVVNPGSGFPNPAGLQGQVSHCVDTSTGPRRGWIYMLASVDPPGPDPMDVMLVRSTDGGTTWSPPIRVNADPQVAGAWQWFGTMSIAPSGRLDVVWNDTRDTLVPNMGRLYSRSSADGGFTWSAEMSIGPVWNSWVGWPNQNKIGDYSDMESDDLGASLAFAATYNGEQDVYYLRIGAEDCNRNGIPDTIDIAAGGGAHDCNGNGIPDSCEFAAGTLVHADADGDGSVTPADVAFFVAAWFADLAAGTLGTDVNRDATVTPADIAAYVLAWYTALSGGC